MNYTTTELLQSISDDLTTLKTNMAAKGVDISENDDFTSLADKIETMSSGAFKVASIAERDALTNVKEGDICVIYDSFKGDWQSSTEASVITFPETVVLNSVPWSTWVSIYDSSSTNLGSISLDDAYFSLNASQSSFNLQVAYESLDGGKTYSRTEFIATDKMSGSSLISGDTVTLPIDIKLSGTVDAVGKFMQVLITTFGGIFIYQNAQWNNANINIDLDPIDLMSGKKAYTNSGEVTGVLGSTINNDNILVYNSLCSSIKNWKPTTMRQLFLDCTLTDLPITRLFGTSSVTSMEEMFRNCRYLKTLDLKSFDTSSVTSMEMMFYLDYALETVDISSFNTSNVTNMARMFQFCQKLTHLDLSHFDTSLVSNINWMFVSCKALTFLDLRTFDIVNIQDKSSIFGSGTDKVPASCLIIVKDDANKNYIKSIYTWLTNIKTVAEYEAEQNNS